MERIHFFSVSVFIWYCMPLWEKQNNTKTKSLKGGGFCVEAMFIGIKNPSKILLLHPAQILRQLNSFSVTTEYVIISSSFCRAGWETWKWILPHCHCNRKCTYKICIQKTLCPQLLCLLTASVFIKWTWDNVTVEI